MTHFLKNRKVLYYVGLSILISTIILLGCVYIDSVSILQIQENGEKLAVAKAGTEAVFTLEGNINSAADENNVQFVFSFLAPRSWKVRENAKVTYKTTLHTDHDEELTMSAVPDNVLPKSGDGNTWAEALRKKYGVGPNVLSDMEWVTFSTDINWNISNGDKPTYTIYLKTNVGDQNLKAYLGFFVNHTNDGLSWDDKHYKVAYSDVPFEVIDGNGFTIDYANYHFNKVEPLASLQDDYITFSFNGGVYNNDLVKSANIYLEAKAYNNEGELIGVNNEKTPNTLMKKTSKFSSTSSITIWPTQFFNIPAGEIISYVEYIFTNEDETVSITKTDDDKAIESNSQEEGSEEKEPFVFELECK